MGGLFQLVGDPRYVFEKGNSGLAVSESLQGPGPVQTGSGRGRGQAVLVQIRVPPARCRVPGIHRCLGFGWSQRLAQPAGLLLPDLKPLSLTVLADTPK